MGTVTARIPVTQRNREGRYENSLYVDSLYYVQCGIITVCSAGLTGLMFSYDKYRLEVLHHISSSVLVIILMGVASILVYVYFKGRKCSLKIDSQEIAYSNSRDFFQRWNKQSTITWDEINDITVMRNIGSTSLSSLPRDFFQDYLCCHPYKLCIYLNSGNSVVIRLWFFTQHPAWLLYIVETLHKLRKEELRESFLEDLSNRKTVDELIHQSYQAYY